jgi:hypothetical protein
MNNLQLFINVIVMLLGGGITTAKIFNILDPITTIFTATITIALGITMIIINLKKAKRIDSEKRHIDLENKKLEMEISKMKGK